MLASSWVSAWENNIPSPTSSLPLPQQYALYYGGPERHDGQKNFKKSWSELFKPAEEPHMQKAKVPLPEFPYGTQAEPWKKEEWVFGCTAVFQISSKIGSWRWKRERLKSIEGKSSLSEVHCCTGRSMFKWNSLRSNTWNKKSPVHMVFLDHHYFNTWCFMYILF